ncbi:EamA family transporter [Hymenobacter sp. 5414T-23]|uniref:EamA family transporter n=1 Tax=Hymenobacter sp. 5414T-23 TaxID=2932252 RepID=UPI001FD51E8C|nr:EamA family transporter [Hymenobacter sp. 5414T-23]UOQ81912.1 EamA family transporter [Hymenobacter sp. 5414T-23]
MRTVVILLLAWGIVYWRGGLAELQTLTSTNLLFLGLSGLATGLSWICYFKALQIGKVSQVAPVDKLSVAIAIVLSVVFLGERLTWQIGVGAGLILIGTFVLIL